MRPGELRRGEWRRKIPAKRWRRRERLKPVSAKRAAENVERAHVRHAVFDRDGWACIGAGVIPHTCDPHKLEAHHLHKASAVGAYEVVNLVTVCPVLNQWVEDHPSKATDLGLVVRAGITHEMAWARMRAAGLVDYDHEGQVVR